MGTFHLIRRALVGTRLDWRWGRNEGTGDRRHVISWVHPELPVSTHQCLSSSSVAEPVICFSHLGSELHMHAKLTFTYGVPPSESPSVALGHGDLPYTLVLTSKVLSLLLRPSHLKSEAKLTLK